MAGTANISSSFVIKYDPADNQQTTIINPGRTFRVVGVGITNTTGGAIDVILTDSAGTNIINGGTFSAANNITSWADLDLTNVEIAANMNLRITCQNAGAEVSILCVASGGGQALATTAP